MEELSRQQCFGGVQAFYRHDSRVIGLPMRFAVFHPLAMVKGPVPVLFYLAGLTCTEETFVIKAGAQRWAAEHGMMLVTPDTSPRNTGIDGATGDWEFGEGASFYLDATQAPWHARFRMESYLIDELLPLVFAEFSADPARTGIFGHSMGGHGALTLALRHPNKFKSVSAFAPICAPLQCLWGEKAFSRYLGEDRSAWAEHDASLLMRQRRTPYPQGILIDQGTADKFLATQLLPQAFEAACAKANQPLILRRQEGYDHSYYFILTFVQDHIAFHHERLRAVSS